MVQKQRVLAWADFPLAGTGFATVAKHVLSALWASNRYDIHQLAINYHGDFLDRNEIPWQVTPAKLLDPADPHGIKMFKKIIEKYEYDIIWILNDLFVIEALDGFFNEVRSHYSKDGRKPPVFIYYYPVDCSVPKRSSAILEQVDIPVCYTDHGKVETLLTRPNIKSRLVQIPHGVSLGHFRPAPRMLINEWKKEMGISPQTTTVINVNRNSTRKQIPYAIQAFKEFKKKVPDSIFFLHMMAKDQGGDLQKIIEDAGLSSKDDVIYAPGFSLHKPLTLQQLNQIYNIGDIFLTTHLGEGWGLTITEAMACGVPVVAPRNTCMPEQLGENSERGYLYPCNDIIYIDSSGFRAKGLIPDIVEQMLNVIKDGPKESNPKIKLAAEYARSVEWSKVTPKWITLFDQAVKIKEQSKVMITEAL